MGEGPAASGHGRQEPVAVADDHHVQRVAFLGTVGIVGAAGQGLQPGAKRFLPEVPWRLVGIDAIDLQPLVVEVAIRQHHGETEAQQALVAGQLDVDIASALGARDDQMALVHAARLQHVGNGRVAEALAQCVHVRRADRGAEHVGRLVR